MHLIDINNKLVFQGFCQCNQVPGVVTAKLFYCKTQINSKYLGKTYITVQVKPSFKENYKKKLVTHF